MEQLKSKLNQVLSEKNWGVREKKLIVECFYYLFNHFSNHHHPEKVLDYIESIHNLDEFQIITDINQDPFFKIFMIPVSSQVLESRSKNAELFSSSVFFRKEKDQYICDQKGNYELTSLGYFHDTRNRISILDHKDIKLIFLHELEHTIQPGFKVDSQYFGSAEIQFILSEGDAMDLPVTVLKDDLELQKRILRNTINYPLELHLFCNLKLLLGQDFIEQWKHDSDMDFMLQIRKSFHEKFSEDILQEIISIIFLLKNINHIQAIDMTNFFRYYQQSLKEISSQIESFKEEIEILNCKIKDYDQEISQLDLQLNNPQFISELVQKERSEYQSSLLEYVNLFSKIKACDHDPIKIKEFFDSINETYQDNINYESLVEGFIKEYEEILLGNNIENKIRSDIEQQRNVYQKQRNHLFSNYHFTQDKISLYLDSYQIYSFSSNIIEKVIQRVNQYEQLNDSEKEFYIDFLKAEIELLFNDCFNQLLNSSLCTEQFVEDYLFLVSSSFVHPFRFLNQDSPVQNQYFLLLQKLKNSRMLTQEKIISEFPCQQKNFLLTEILNNLKNFDIFKLSDQNQKSH